MLGRRSEGSTPRQGCDAYGPARPMRFDACDGAALTLWWRFDELVRKMALRQQFCALTPSCLDFATSPAPPWTGTPTKAGERKLLSASTRCVDLFRYFPNRTQSIWAAGRRVMRCGGTGAAPMGRPDSRSPENGWLKRRFRQGFLAPGRGRFAVTTPHSPARPGPSRDAGAEWPDVAWLVTVPVGYASRT